MSVRPITKSYRVATGERNKRLHRVRAEQALGRPLPPKAVVHHADGSRADHAPLVICQNQTYHLLLHLLARVRQAGGDPFADRICYTCRRVLPFAMFYGKAVGPRRRGWNCRDCCRIADRQHYIKTRKDCRC